MKYLRLLLFPFSLIYGLMVIMRNWCYDVGWLKSREFELPVISVGNLAVGGAGKSPMVEYLIGLFKNDHQLAILSRGYGRKTKGFINAAVTNTAADIGDEPAQFKHKFSDVTVAVCEKRVEGIERLKNNHDLIILDDAYQHRAVKPGLSLLLFDYNKLNEPRMLLPAGNMREPFSGRWRADAIVITKCPAHLNNYERDKIASRMMLLPYQQLFFTTIQYQPMQDLAGNKIDGSIDKDTTVFLLTGIANADPLVAHIKTLTSHIIHYNYPDHHQFSLKNIIKLADEFAACASQKKMIVTTEKDAQRLGEQELQPLVKQLPVFVMPIGISFLNNEQQQFDQFITEYVRKYREHRQLH